MGDVEDALVDQRLDGESRRREEELLVGLDMRVDARSKSSAADSSKPNVGRGANRIDVAMCPASCSRMLVTAPMPNRSNTPNRLEAVESALGTARAPREEMRWPQWLEGPARCSISDVG